jgi:hypothetical protein
MYTANFRSNQFCDQEHFKTISDCRAWIAKQFRTVENSAEAFAYVQNGRKMYGIQVAGSRDMMLNNIKDRYMTMDQIWDEVELLRKISRAVNGKKQQEESREIISAEAAPEAEESREIISAEAAPDQQDETPAAEAAPAEAAEQEAAPAAPVFTAHSMTTAAGETLPAAWHMYAGQVIGEITLPDGSTAAVTIDEKNAWYIPAMCAAQEAERIAQAEAAAEKERRRAERRAARAADPDKQAHGPIPEKDWIGTKVQGLGYVIEFSRTYDRTMIKFDSTPTEAARAIVKEAGFYWAPTLKAWVKGLNWKAYRAALKVQEAFTAAKEAPCKPKGRRAA